MTKFGLKRIPAPESWNIGKKKAKFTLRPFPGRASFKEGLAVGTILRDYLNMIDTMREGKHVLKKHDILINGKKVRKIRQIVGLMDVITLAPIKKSFRLMVTKKGKLHFVEVGDKEKGLVPVKIKKISILKKNRIQINLKNGQNIIVKKKGYKPGDTVIFDYSKNKIADHFKMEKGSYVYLTGGKHVGNKGNVKEIESSRIIIESEDKKELETNKRHAYVLGKGKSAIKITK